MVITTLEKAFKMASKLSDDEQKMLAFHWIQEMKTPNFLEVIKDEMKWEESFSKSQDVLEMLADEALRDIEQGRAEEIGWDKL
ncbi:hypothetical protein H8E88_13880 [candidate division KSB1 bacterium]|nr:hypothetical protein [candidate division KSB1 bacterium]